MKYTIKIALNGTDKNPWHKFGLTQNPFPQTAKAEYDKYCLIVQSLGGDPIPDTDYIRNKLQDFLPKFIELCCQRFMPGKYVEFDYSWEE